MTPVSRPVAITLTDTPSGADEKHTAVIFCFVDNLAIRAALIECRYKTEPPEVPGLSSFLLPCELARWRACHCRIFGSPRMADHDDDLTGLRSSGRSATISQSSGRSGGDELRSAGSPVPGSAAGLGVSQGQYELPWR